MILHAGPEPVVSGKFWIAVNSAISDVAVMEIVEREMVSTTVDLVVLEEEEEEEDDVVASTESWILSDAGYIPGVSHEGTEPRGITIIPAVSTMTGVATPPTITMAARPAAGIIGNPASISLETCSLTKVTLSAGFDGLVTVALAESEVGMGMAATVIEVAVMIAAAADELGACVEELK